MGTEPEPGAESSSARAPTASVLIPIAVLALVAVTAVMLFTRASTGAEAAAEGANVEGEVPTTLVGGIDPAPVPARVREAVDLPVIGAADGVDVPDIVLKECSTSNPELVWDAGEPTIESSVATTDVMLVSLIGKGAFEEGMGFEDEQGNAPERFRMECTAQQDGGAWFSESSTFEPVFEDGAGDHGMGGGGYSCCDENGLATASARVEVLDGAAWALQDRGGWYVAYPLAGRTSLTVTWKFREQRFGPGGPPQSAITFLNRKGEILGEAFAGGQF